MNIGVAGLIFLGIIFASLYGMYSYYKNPRRMIGVGVLYVIFALGSFLAGAGAIGGDPIVGVIQFFLGFVFAFGAAKMLLHKGA